MNPSARPDAAPTRAMSRVSAKHRNRGCHSGRYFTLDRYSDSICHQRDATSSSRRQSRTIGPAPIRAPSSNADRKTAKLSDTRRMPISRPAAIRPVTMNSVTPLSASGCRRITSRENPSVPHGTKDKTPATSAIGPIAGRLGREQRLHHQAVGIGRVAEPAERHREAALGLGVAPGVDLADQLHQFGVGDVGVQPDPGPVAHLLQPLDGLPDRPHVPAVQMELPGLEDRLVAQPDDPQPGSRVRGRARLARPDHRRRPAVGVEQVLPGLDRRRPVIRRPDRVAAGQADAQIHPIGDRRAAVGGEDHRLVAPGGEVGQRVLRRLGDQRAYPGLVLGRHHRRPALRTHQGDDRRQQGQAEEQADHGVDPARRDADRLRDEVGVGTEGRLFQPFGDPHQPAARADQFVGEDRDQQHRHAEGHRQTDQQGDQGLARAARLAARGELGAIDHHARGERAERGQVEPESSQQRQGADSRPARSPRPRPGRRPGTDRRAATARR